MHVEVKIDHIVHRTDLAVLVAVEDREVWIPKSLFSEDHDIPEVGEGGTIWIAKWRAVEEGFEFIDEQLHPLLRKDKHRFVGAKVTHKVFGEGKVDDVQGDKVVVIFGAPHGKKTIIARCVEGLPA